MQFFGRSLLSIGDILRDSSSARFYLNSYKFVGKIDLGPNRDKIRVNDFLLLAFLMLYLFLRDGMDGVDQFEAKQTEKELATDPEKNSKQPITQPPYAASPDIPSTPPEFAPYGYYPDMPNDQSMRYGSPSFTQIQMSQPVGFSQFDNGFVPMGASVPQYFYPEPSSTPYHPSAPLTPPYF